MKERIYRFDERYAMSRGTAQNCDAEVILLSHIPGAISVRPSIGADDRLGTDWWVEHASGKELSVDAKVRSRDFAVGDSPKDDLALETFSVIEHGKIGWTRDQNKRTDYILWLWKDTHRWCLIPFPMLCRVFQNRWQEWVSEFGAQRQATENGNGCYHSECVFVPRRIIWAEIYRMFSGTPQRMETNAKGAE